jgi:hypothetical protein
MSKQILHGHALTKRNVPPNPSEQGHGNGHDTQTADLNQHQDHTLTENGEPASGIQHRQTGDAYSGRCSKQGIYPMNVSGFRGNWELENEHAKSYHQKEARQHKNRRMRFKNATAQGHGMALGFK